MRGSYLQLMIALDHNSALCRTESTNGRIGNLTSFKTILIADHWLVIENLDHREWQILDCTYGEYLYQMTKSSGAGLRGSKNK